MELKIISSSSAGNCYLLENEKEALIIEAGVRFEQIKKGLNFNLSKVVACIITHEDGDHCKAVQDVMAAGITVYASAGTHNAMGTSSHHRAAITDGTLKTAGGFQFKSFDVKHDATEPVGYLIKHAETGNVLFLTDTYFCEYSFSGLNNIIIEANYSQDILDEQVKLGVIHRKLRNRIIISHMSIDTCIDLLMANDLRQVNNIVLIHLSDKNSNAIQFKQRVEESTGKCVHVADVNQIINFNRNPF
ncbi:Phosphoribosyl 1,2-cyclic phosphodiesterase [Chitinophaga sp. YR573]|uniref:MBL fold metallo-hydrolase n=1 Tax=Chitinophaga sp. YR573 TaxID=1881040 RepID=UPI0008B4E24C|nr:MBL fold metallo-hydrolase [Chitinophaga sp. YR573]SEV88546.1 Phosphoribosyl 1,2-cyclic phosphodiesterase [Chitinophaga sp. YR573]